MSLLIEEEPPLFKMADFSYTKRKIEEEEEVQKNEQYKSSLASKLQKFISNSKLDDYLEFLNAVISLLMACIFAVESNFHLNDPREEQGRRLIWLEYIEIGLMLLIIADFLLFFFIHENRIVFIFSLDSLLAFVTIVPTILIRFNYVTD